MTLLICTASARADTPDGALLGELLHAIDARYPFAFSIVVTPEPPASIERAPHRDWVTLPSNQQGVWRDAAVCAGRMLSAYARQLSPVATLLVGQGAVPLRQLCGAEAQVGFGTEVIIESTAEDALQRLYQALDRSLPAVFVISNATARGDVAQLVEKHRIQSAISLYWTGAFSSRCSEVVEQVLTVTTGMVKVQIRVRDLLHNPAVVARGLIRLSHHSKGRLQLSFAAEDGAALRTGKTMSHIFFSLQGKRRP